MIQDPFGHLGAIADELRGKRPIAPIPEVLREAMQNAGGRDIADKNGDLYMGRTDLWREATSGARVHHIAQADSDRHLHDHPWAWSFSLILAGGYEEDRLFGDRTVRRVYRQGDYNMFFPGDYHRIADVVPGTWTLFLTGARLSSWGFLVDGIHVDQEKYLSGHL